MSLISCPNCGMRISEFFASCCYCGSDMPKILQLQEKLYRIAEDSRAQADVVDGKITFGGFARGSLTEGKFGVYKTLQNAIQDTRERKLSTDLSAMALLTISDMIKICASSYADIRCDYYITQEDVVFHLILTTAIKMFSDDRLCSVGSRLFCWLESANFSFKRKVQTVIHYYLGYIYEYGIAVDINTSIAKSHYKKCLTNRQSASTIATFTYNTEANTIENTSLDVDNYVKCAYKQLLAL